MIYCIYISMVFLWNFKISKEDIEFRSECVYSLSPYFKRNKNYYGYYYFKSLYHWIFGIQY